MPKRNRFFGGNPENQSVFSRPLLLRFGLALTAVAGLALFTMVASVMIADTAKDDAAAINQAGSLRMQSYRILAMHQAGADESRLIEAREHFEQTMSGDAIRRSLPRAPHSLVDHYNGLREHWRERMLPLLDIPATEQATLEAAVGTFVAELEALVRGLQREAETRIQMLRLIQGIAIFMTLALVFGTMYLLHTGVVLPLRELMGAADRARDGDLGARSSHTSNDEIGLLGNSFNTMAAHLQQLHGNLERQVENKTQDLKRSNDALKLLYDAARTLTPEHLDGDAQKRIMQRLQQVIETGPITLCLTQPERNNMAYRSYCSGGSEMPDFCAAPVCEPCLRNDAGRLGSATESGVAAIPLRDGGNHYGVLLIQYPPGGMPDQWKFRLAEAVADQIASAHGRARELRQQRRLALLDERSVIARELHDSLAQSLSYLKIQLSRLQGQLRGEAGERALPIITELREGLNEAYRNLRELLTTFRLKMNESGLEHALEETVNEFSQRGRLPIRLDARVSGQAIDPNIEINILQIVREALTNVINHAEARRAGVTLESATPGYWILTVEDDGIGLQRRHHKSHHYGTQIMRERAESLGGTLEFDRPGGGGTRVRAVLPQQPQRIEQEHHEYDTDTGGR